MNLYTSKVVSQWIGVSERRVRQLRDEGIITEARPGLYELQPTVRRYIRFLGGEGKENYNAERTKLTAAKRRAAELDNQQREGDLHSTADFERGLKTMILNIRSRFLIIPAKCAPAIAAMGGDQAGIYDTLKGAIDEALEEMSEYNAAMAMQNDEEKESAE